MTELYKKLTRRKWLWILAGAAAGVAAILLTFALSIPIRSETLKQRVIMLLTDQLESEVTIEQLEGRIFPRVSVSGAGVIIRQKGRTDVPPLIAISRFEIRGSFRDLMRHPRQVAEVRLQGLEVNIPPGDDDDDKEGGKSDADNLAQARKLEQVIIDRFETPDTVVTLIPKRAGKQPKVFTVHHLVMDRLGINQTIPYIATLTNPVPKGDIETSGTFGPWNVAHPAHTPIAGQYVFNNANLDTIDGIAGTLRSTGSFSGPINRIQVEGITDTPDFQIDVGGAPVPLTTQFTAVVDGSDGDTYLKRVDAKILNSELTAHGAVIGFEGVRGRQIEVDVTMPGGRIEDLLTLTVASAQPILLGDVHLQAKLVIPPEKKKVIDKMRLRGEFGLTKARFTNKGVQTKLTGLSRRGQGIHGGEPFGDVLSNLRGRLVLENGVASFPTLTFSVPGAQVRLAGRYGMRSGDLNFRGTLAMEAPLSRVLGGGVKGFFLRAFDPFFRKPGAGTVLPIRITGTRKEPKFGLDMFQR
jgi:AsmA-like C-terminal region